MTSTTDKTLLVADYFIKKNEEDKKGLDPIKMQKLLYYAQAWNLVFTKNKLFSDDFQAWVHGPAIPRVWQHFRTYDFATTHPEVSKEDFSALTAQEKEVLDLVWNVYGKYPGNYLEILSHDELPWQEARGNLAPHEASQQIISTDTMLKFYEQKLEHSTKGN